MSETTAAPEPKKSQAELEAEIAATRAELVDSIDALTARLDPRHLAAEAGAGAKQAATDTASLLTGKGMPQDAPKRERNVKILLGVVGTIVVGTGLRLVRRARR